MLLLLPLLVVGQSCDSHDECTESGEPFCYCGECAACNECHYCDDGVDGTCGDCGSRYPLHDSNCDGSNPCGSDNDFLTQLTGDSTYVYVIGGIFTVLLVMGYFWKKNRQQAGQVHQHANQVQAQVNQVPVTAPIQTTAMTQQQSEGQQPVMAQPVIQPPYVASHPTAYAVAPTQTLDEAPPSYDQVTADAPPAYSDV